MRGDVAQASSVTSSDSNASVIERPLSEEARSEAAEEGKRTLEGLDDFDVCHARLVLYFHDEEEGMV